MKEIRPGVDGKWERTKRVRTERIYDPMNLACEVEVHEVLAKFALNLNFAYLRLASSGMEPEIGDPVWQFSAARVHDRVERPCNFVEFGPESSLTE